MTWKVKPLLGLLAFLCLGSPGLAQDSSSPRSGDPDCWINDKIVNLFVRRAAKEMADSYDCDEYQRQLLEESLVSRVSEFMDQNRGELRPLLNDYIEKALGSEPPTPEDAAQWARRALPMLEKVGGLVTTVSDDVRTFFTPEQVDRLDSQLAAMDVGVSFMQHRLVGWSDGHFDVATEWPGSAEFKSVDRERRREIQTAMENARREVLGEPLLNAPPAHASTGAGAGGGVIPVSDVTPAPAPVREAPKDEWTLYVEDFCRRYALNDEQRQQASLALRKQHDALDNYLRRKADEMTRIEKLFGSAKEKGEIDRAESAYQKLMEPKKNMFEILKRDLDRIPTRKQRQEATTETASKPK